MLKKSGKSCFAVRKERVKNDNFIEGALRALPDDRLAWRRHGHGQLVRQGKEGPHHGHMELAHVPGQHPGGPYSRHLCRAQLGPVLRRARPLYRRLRPPRPHVSRHRAGRRRAGAAQDGQEQQRVRGRPVAAEGAQRASVADRQAGGQQRDAHAGQLVQQATVC